MEERWEMRVQDKKGPWVLGAVEGEVLGALGCGPVQKGPCSTR